MRALLDDDFEVRVIVKGAKMMRYIFEKEYADE